jgi:hypothetical protein
MHPEYIEKAPRGAGWYILLEDGAMLEGGPFPSEEATWAEIALREPRGESEHGRATLGPRPTLPGPGAPNSGSMKEEAHGHSGCVCGTRARAIDASAGGGP